MKNPTKWLILRVSNMRKYFLISQFIILCKYLYVNSPSLLFVSASRPSWHSNIRSTNGVSLGRDYLLVQPMAEGLIAWNNSHYFCSYVWVSIVMQNWHTSALFIWRLAACAHMQWWEQHQALTLRGSALHQYEWIFQVFISTSQKTCT